MRFFYITFFVLFSIFVSAEVKNDNTVSTNSGIVEGRLKKGIIFWEDIPYAQPPVGELRWKAPRDIQSNDAKIYPKDNNFCIQKNSNLGGTAQFSDRKISGSEDCLYLDIFAPKKKSESLLPVMFWIHGGGNTSGLKDLYDFSKMVKKHNVIVVRINYRLGPFGWFTHPAIQNLQNGIDKTSNFGTLDIVSALKWVNINIHRFGGNPNNITIFGESAGGHNVYSLMVNDQAKGLFQKAISMSGYTTSISVEDSYKPLETSSIYNQSSWNIVNKITNNKQNILKTEDVRKILYSMSSDDFFGYYVDRKSYEEIPLLTADGIVIPQIGLKDALSNKEYVNNLPIISGSNRDEVKLWLATATYFVDLDYSFLGSILRIPKVVLKDEDAFEAFNFYRSQAWKIRGVDDPIDGFLDIGIEDVYAYRFDWDDHRKLLIADFKKLIGAAHATEIPILTGNSLLVGGYPLSGLIYPNGVSKKFTSKNMMKYWTNFAKYGEPGKSTNNIQWKRYDKENKSFLIIDSKKNLKMDKESYSLKSLSIKLFNDSRVNDLEKCVILLQMFTFVGNDIYDQNIKEYPGKCDRKESEKFLIDNASFIEY